MVVAQPGVVEVGRAVEVDQVEVVQAVAAHRLLSRSIPRGSTPAGSAWWPLPQSHDSHCTVCLDPGLHEKRDRP